MKRYAFIDVLNTEGTTSKLCGFYIDWYKLCEYLQEEWNCEKSFFYTGIENGDYETEKEFNALDKLKCSVVRTKPVQIYKKPNRRLEIACTHCGENNVATVDMGYDKKGNCDVDLTLDALECAAQETDFYFFTGDGDFEPLIRKSIEKGVRKVRIVSSNKTIIRAGIPNRRLATKLKGLFKEFPEQVDLIDIDSLKFKIQKVIT